MHAARSLNAASLALPLIACWTILAPAHAVEVAVNPPCADPIVGAAFKLSRAKEFDRAQAALAPALRNPEAAVCAAEMSVKIEAARKLEPKVGAVQKAWQVFLDSVLKIGFWLAIALALTVAVLVFGGALRLMSLVRRKFFHPGWRVYRVAPGSEPTIVKAWLKATGSGPRSVEANAHLLIVSGIPLPHAVATVRPVSPDIDLVTGAPDIQGVSLNWISRLIALFLRYCRSPRRTFAVTVTSHEKSAIMTIDACDANAKVRELTATAVWTSDLDVAQEIDKMAAALALKTNYLMSDGATDAGLAMLTALHAGIEKLNSYSQANNPLALREAAESFAAAGEVAKNDLRPLLYQGIALELLENHDKAQRLFTQIGGTKPITEQSSRVEMQAAYNIAVSHLRRYRAAEVEQAAELFACIVREIEALPTEKRSDEAIGLQAFANAACANSYAHYFIFWNEIGQTGTKDIADWVSVDLKNKEQQLQGWADQSKALADSAEAAVASGYFLNEPILATQLRWLICNARGNLALNRASCSGPADVSDKCELLKQALAEFQACEILVQPGVETLTNIATTLLRLDQPTPALAYTRRARALNPRYEYAWFREYQVEESRGEREAMMTLLREASATLEVIAIPEFKEKFRRAGIRFHER